MRELTAVESIWLVMGRELRAQRTSFLSWLVPLAGLVALMVSIQPQAAGQNGLLEAKLAMMPEALKQAFNLAGTDFTRPAGYLSVNFITVTMGATIFAGLLGATVVSREDAQRTAEAVLTLPVTRWQVLLGKGLTVVSLLVAFHAVLLTVTVATLVSVVPGDRQLELVAAMYAGAAMLGVCFAALGFAIATFVSQARAAPNLSLGLVLGVYLLGVVAKLSPKGEGLAAISPFALVEPSEIVKHGGLSLHALWLPLIALAASTAAIAWYERRDVHA